MTHLLDMITNPNDLRFMTKGQLHVLAEEIREKIINTVAKTGGHLASSLGVVELTIALHYVFDTPKDKIVWDVGHQTYSHKLLTGRAKKFDTLRQYKGISGFPKREESIYDTFNTGHSSTSISAALGIAKARDLKKQDHNVIAVIGDGALTGGMSFEALNQAGHLKSNIIVILNDNKMSISKNVGAMTSYLRRMVTDPKYVERRKKAIELLQKLPMISKKTKTILDLEETVRAFTSTAGLLFRELGFRYFGPVDGHSLKESIAALKNVKQLEGPILLHVVTEKGHGYKYAEQDKTKFHGISKFDIETGEKICPNCITYTDAFSRALIKLAEEDEKVVAITAAMTSGTGLDKFKQRFPDRFFDVGIAEQHAVTFAAGLATEGFKPVIAIYSTFLQRAYDQIVHDVALQKLPVTFCIDRAGLVGEDGATHHGVFDLSYLRHIPNITMMAPKDEGELGHMLKTALSLEGPVTIRYPRGVGPGAEIANPYHKISVGKSEVLVDGKDLTIFAVGSMVNEAMNAAKELKKRKINASVVNVRFVKPLDKPLILKLANKTHNILTVEENALGGGFGSAILELLEQNKVKADVKRLGIPDRFIEHGNMDILKKKIGLTKENILKEALKIAK